MTEFSKAMRTVAVLAVAALAGCGGAGSDGSGVSSGSTSGGQATGASQSPAAPETPKIDLKATAPQGKYRLVEKLASVEPRSAAAEWKGTTNGVLKGSWQVLVGACTETACSGLIKSSFGSVATYSWDGSKLTVSRDDDFDALCRSGSGKVKTTYHYTYDLQAVGPATVQRSRYRARCAWISAMAPGITVRRRSLRLARWSKTFS